MGLIIQRHGVPSDPKTKLSPLQTALLHSPEKVRIANAPTGAGKSYVFQRAMIDKGDRILFIVPTRSLAQNLKFSLLTALIKEAKWDQTKANNKVKIWSSDTTEQLKKAGKIGKGKISITGFRIREIYELDDTREGGEMIFATPEVVSGILLRGSFLNAGQSDAGVIDLLCQFDHIVFDEFHTIEARGFGMAAVLAKLAAVLVDRCRAKISFLSATALDIKPTLLDLGVPEEQIKPLEETITYDCADSDRPIHGNVELLFEQTERLVDLIAEHANEIRAEIESGHLVVVIYNKLADLQRQSKEIATFLETLGIKKNKRLLINSIDGSRRGEAEFKVDFQFGSDKNPNDFDVLIATSSVEMGVTFKTRLLFMEPGFEPLNFLQRYGRVARGNLDGKVFVRLDDWLFGKMPWLRQLHKWAKQNEGKTLTIKELSEKLRHTVVEWFEPQAEEVPSFFGHLPNRAKYTAGLYWHLLHQQKSNNQYVKQFLLDNFPKQAQYIRTLLKTVRKMAEKPEFRESVTHWCDEFENEAKILRQIGRRIKIVEQNGNTLTVDEHFLQREAANVLETGFLLLNEEGHSELHINGDFHLDDVSRYVPKQKYVIFPHKPHGITLDDDNELVKKWCDCLTNPRESYIWKGYEDAIEAAKKLVNLTGLVVTGQQTEEIEMAVSSGT